MTVDKGALTSIIKRCLYLHACAPDDGKAKSACDFTAASSNPGGHEHSQVMPPFHSDHQ